MILDIYESMLNTAKNGIVPKSVEMGFIINKEGTKKFWADKSLSHEHALLLDEWEPKEKGVYTKIFYGINFVIQFTY